jgi:hypothetical protein
MTLKALIKAFRRRRTVTPEGTPRQDLPPAGNIADANTTLRGR